MLLHDRTPAEARAEASLHATCGPTVNRMGVSVGPDGWATVMDRLVAT